MLAIQNLYSGYKKGRDIIKNLSMTVQHGEIVCVLGPNGCGKSTLLKTIVRILEYRGSIALKGTELSSYTRKNLAQKIALLGQASQIYFPYTVYETVALGRYAHCEGFLNRLSPADEALIRETLEKLGLYDLKDRLINELSGGQLQMVFLARTLVQNPQLILLDEPTNHLDPKHQIELLYYLKTWVKEGRRAVIGVLHDLNLAGSFCDTAALMQGGTILAHGTAGEVLNSEILKAVYGVDVRQFMVESLGRWRQITDKR
ncbi:MAG: ABC transporter ATP-binding protein [Spirochaetaceae bacterium]|jgi:iron complex transport system ATP-binding protein|nr:ABC transporter ATP-binding protein [Spirochaetaceae bacterium]